MKYKIYSKKPLGEEILSKFPGTECVDIPDFVFSFGGDGTFLKGYQNTKELSKDIIYVPINSGHIGFYTEYEMSELDFVLSLIEHNNYRIRKYPILDIEVVDRDGIKLTQAINEIVISNPVRTAVIDVYINGEHFETYRGTGMLVSTPSGSTAYNKSVGGSVVDFGIDTIQITEIAPINNRLYKSLNSSLIMSSETIIDLVIHNKDNTFVCVDGKNFTNGEVNKINIRYSLEKVKVLVKNKSQFEKIKNTFLK